MARYKLWDKNEDIITPGRDKETGRMQWTAPEYIERFAPWCNLPGAIPVCGGGMLTGAFFDELNNMKAHYEKLGAAFDPSLTNEELLAAIEDFEDNVMNAVSTEPSVEERIAAALEFQNLLAMEDVVV